MNTRNLKCFQIIYEERNLQAAASKVFYEKSKKIIKSMNEMFSEIHTLVKNGIGIGIAPRFFADEEDVRAISINDAYSWDVYGIYLESSADAQLAKRFLSQI